MAKKLIRLPERVTGIRIGDIDLENRAFGYDGKRYFERRVDEWHVFDKEEFMKTNNPVWEAHMEVSSGTLIHGLNNSFGRGSGLYNWDSQGGRVGKLYQMSEKDLRRVGSCDITAGKVSHPLSGPGTSLTHQVPKKDILKAGDIVVATRESGDQFHDYELLIESKNELYRVEGMDFSAYTFGNEGSPIVPVQLTLKHF